MTPFNHGWTVLSQSLSLFSLRQDYMRYGRFFQQKKKSLLPSEENKSNPFPPDGSI